MLPYSAAVFVPPNWDRRYAECFGFTLEQIFEEGARSFESKLRAAGMPIESLPGAIPYPHDLDPAERARRGIRMLEAGLMGEGNGPPPRDPETMELLFDMLRRGVDPRYTPAEPLTLQWDFPDAEPWHLRVDNGQHRGGGRLRPATGRDVQDPLRRLRRGVRRPAGSAPRDAHRPDAAARVGQGAVVRASSVRLAMSAG